jgi:Flp pilus assembly protein TadD
VIWAKPKARSAAHYNLGLLLAEKGQPDEAIKELRKTVQLDKSNAAATYNHAVLLAPTNLAYALALARKAAAAEPENPKCSSAVAYYEQQSKRTTPPAGLQRN